MQVLSSLAGKLQPNECTQLYGHSRQCGHPVGALIEWEFHSNQLINGLVQHTFNLLFLENFQVIP